MANKKRDYYTVLGVNKSASLDEVKKAYRKAALKWHPDRFKSDSEKKTAEERFKEIGEAYAILSDPEKKKLYDQFGHGAFDPRASPGPGGVRFTTFDFGDASQIFEEFFGGGFSSAFGGGSGRRGRSRSNGGTSDFFDMGDLFGKGSQEGRTGFQSSPHQIKGSDVHLPLKLSFEESMQGVSKKIRLSKGVSTDSQTVRLKIPPGITDGSKLKVKGQGKPGAGGGPPGDIIINIKVESHPKFTREGQSLIIKASISLKIALIGGDIDVPTWNGRQVKINIPPGIQSNSRIRVSNKGVPGKNGSTPGDMFVVAQIQIPKSITQRQKELIQEFDEIERKKDN